MSRYARQSRNGALWKRFHAAPLRLTTAYRESAATQSPPRHPAPSLNAAVQDPSNAGSTRSATTASTAPGANGASNAAARSA